MLWFLVRIISTEQILINKQLYNRDGTYLKKIELAGQEQQMTTALLFTIDKRGNFIITEHSINEIRIFSPDGVLKHTLGRGHLRFLNGIAQHKLYYLCVSWHWY